MTIFVRFSAIILSMVASPTLAHEEFTPLPIDVESAIVPMSNKEVNDYPPYRHPPVNILSKDQPVLFRNAVFVNDRSRYDFLKNYPAHTLEIVVFRANGFFVSCTPDRKTNYRGKYAIGNRRYFFAEIRHTTHWYPAMTFKRQVYDIRDGLFPLYDGESGRLLQWRKKPRRSESHLYYPSKAGHLQYDIPRAVYDLCPDFPSADELGLEINEAQTANTYYDLIAQHPGNRILRPDLVTPNAHKYGGPNGSEPQPSQNDSVNSK